MVYDIDDIRNGFSGGSVYVDSKRIIVSYNHDDEWFTQDFNQGTIFQSLLEGSESIELSISAHRHIWIVFNIDIGRDSAVVYPALNAFTRTSLEELAADFNPEPERYADFMKYMQDADRSDPISVVSKSADWIDSVLKSERDGTISLSAKQRCERYRKLAPLLAQNGMFCETEIADPSDSHDGYMTLTFSESTHIPKRITGKLKEILEECVRISPVSGINGCVNQDILEITFFA